MRAVNNRLSPESASRIADYALEHMVFNNPEKEVDVDSAHEYLTQAIMEYDELFPKVGNSSMDKGVFLMEGGLYAATKLTDYKEEEEE